MTPSPLVGTMIEQRNNDNASALFGRYLALVEVNGVRYCPFRFETYEEGGYTYLRSWMLLTSKTGAQSNPSATTLYEAQEQTKGEGSNWQEYYEENVWPTLGVKGPCTFEQALKWLNADGATYTIVPLS